MWLAQKLVNNENLKLVAMPALDPPDVQVDPETIKRYELEFNVIILMAKKNIFINYFFHLLFE